MPINPDPKQAWRIFATACEAINCGFTAECIRNAVDSGADKYYSDTSLVASKIRQSRAFANLLSEARRSIQGNSQFAKTIEMQFTSSDNLDLYASLHRVSAWVVGKKINNGKSLSLDIKVTDIYDFDYNNVGLLAKDKAFINKLGDMANNLAYYSTIMGYLKTYKITINMNYIVDYI
ncbi:hypothetical protein [Clostridium sp. Marseille-QA1073]